MKTKAYSFLLLLSLILLTGFYYLEDPKDLTKEETEVVELVIVNGHDPVLVTCADPNGNVVAYGAECTSPGTRCLENDCPEGSEAIKE